MLLTGLSQLFFTTIGLLGISFLIGFHEFGHLLFCKLFSIPAPLFSIGCGPRIWQKKIGDTVFALSAIPFGGYVEIGEETDPNSKNLPFKDRPYYQKLLVMCGGIFCNLLFAYVAFSLLFALGMPKSPFLYPRNATTTISMVEPEGPAAKAGIIKEDRIIAINDKPVASFSEIIQIIDPLVNEKAILRVQRGNEVITIPVTLSFRITDQGLGGYLGVTPTFIDLAPMSFMNALGEGFSFTNKLIVHSLKAFVTLARKRTTQGLGGPIMLISATISGARQGIKVFLLFLAFISVNLAVLNMLPLPILDGGQIFLTTIEAIIRRPISEIIRWYIFMACWLALAALMLYLSFHDIRSLLQ
jgi:regulator of sigma E protease